MEREHPELSALEWRAVVVALRDSERRIRLPIRRPWPVTLWRTVIGMDDLRPLADPRLEAVRAFVHHAKRHRRSDDALAGRLLELGFNGRQVRALSLLAA